MSTIGVFILTTEGPVRIEAIHRRRMPPRSEITVGQDYAQRLRATKDYDLFVSSAGPVGQAFGPFEPECFRLQVEAPFDDGNSWELACFLAHALFKQSRLAGPDAEVDEIVMLTGRVDLGYQVGAVGYIKDKIDKAGAAVERWHAEGAPITLVVPDPDPLNVTGPPDGAEIFRCGRVADLMHRFDLPWIEPKMAALAKEDKGSSLSPRRLSGKGTAPLLLFGALALTAGIFWLLIYHPALQESATKLEAPPQSKAWLRVYERRPPSGKSCANVYFGTSEAQLAPLAADPDGRLPDSSLARLCGLRFEMGLAEDWRGFAWIERRAGDFLQDGRPRPWESAQDFTNALGWSVDLPRRMAGRLDYRVILIAGEGADSEGLRDLEKFASDGGTVITLVHRVNE